MTTTQFYLEHFQLYRAPFDQQPDTEIVFPLPSRKKILENLLADIEDGKALVKLTGSEGTGKTLMCKLLEKELEQERYLLISLEHPIGSFQNLLRTVCFLLGTIEEENDDEDSEPLDYVVLFKEHLQRIGTEGRRLVLLIDEAESLFLATLERLIRLVCDTDEYQNLQILLVGRLELDEHLDQLSIYCANVDIKYGYTLEALSLDQTTQYIQFRLQGAGIPGDKYLDLFTPDAIEMIYQGAMGNISLTNSLAESGLKKACEHGMFQVDDELIQPEQTIEDNVSLAFFQGFDFLKDNKWWILVGTLLVWLVLVFFLSGNHDQEEDIAGNEKLEIIAPEVEIVIPPEPEISEIAPVEPVASLEEQPVESVPEKPQAAEESPVKELQPTQQSVATEQDEIIITPEHRKKKIVISQPVLPEQIKEERKTPTVVTQQPPVKKEHVAVRDGDALFKERVRATSSWLAWAYRGGYTIQLMVLASETAEENLKRILVDHKFFEIRDQLYILKKRSPKTLYLFYGNYQDMEAARKARNTMPPFLKEIHPYALSIQDALKKTQER